MATPVQINEERLLKKTTTKEIYEYVDSEKGIKQKSREVLLNEDVTIHYPIGYSGGSKYKNIKRIIFEGFGKRLPVGIQKSVNRGYGFTKTLKPVADFLDEGLEIKEIRIIKNGVAEYDSQNDKITLNEDLLRDWNTIFESMLSNQKQDRDLLAHQKFYGLFQDKISEPQLKYVKNSIAQSIAGWESSYDEFSNIDKEAIVRLFEKLTVKNDFLTPDILLRTKEKIDEQYFEEVLEQFKDLLKETKDSERLEKKWQAFLKKHSWIFSFIFSFPVILYQDEAYVGGKNMSNKNGKLNDFLIKSDLTNNVAFVEIKTHKTELLTKGRAYRGDDVFAMSKELSGSLIQVLNQRDKFQKHFHHLRYESKSDVETFNSKCLVLIGTVTDLQAEQVSAFELFRGNSKDVEIVTFDELLRKIEGLQKLMKGEA